jgi:hypothetical protein
MVLTMVYNTELLGFWTFSIVWYSREHDVSETGCVSVLRWRWGRTHSETSCSLEYQTMEKVQKPSNLWRCFVISFNIIQVRIYRTIWLFLDSVHRLVCGSFTKDHDVSETGSVSVRYEDFHLQNQNTWNEQKNYLKSKNISRWRRIEKSSDFIEVE